MSATGMNLQRIQDALDQHDRACDWPVKKILMNHYEVERLGFDDFNGIPIVGDQEIGTPVKEHQPVGLV